MVTPTFLRLPQAKRALIEQALLDEFSRAPLAQAQVSNIVKQTGIARGAFYRYFTDIDDAYQYMLGVALRDIHTGISSYQAQQTEPTIFEKPQSQQQTDLPANTMPHATPPPASPASQHSTDLQQRYYQRTADFVHSAANSRYWNMMYWYYQDNGVQFAGQQPNPNLSAQDWTIATLTHQTIRDCMLDKEHATAYLARLQQSLQALQITEIH